VVTGECTTLTQALYFPCAFCAANVRTYAAILSARARIQHRRPKVDARPDSRHQSVVGRCLEVRELQRHARESFREAFDGHVIAEVRRQDVLRGAVVALVARVVLRIVRRGEQRGPPRLTSVAGLPSVSASRIAVIGRQSSKWYFASQAEMTASAMATLSSANSRALSESERCRARDALAAARFQNAAAVPPQKRADVVWSAERVRLPASPGRSRESACTAPRFR
jgi:hypothetical protein